MIGPMMRRRGDPTRGPRPLRVAVLLAVVCAFVFVAFPPVAMAVGPNAIMTPTGYNVNTVARGDDNSSPTVGLPFTMNWFGAVYNTVYINMNGNVTFGQPYGGYTPTNVLNNTGQDIMAPFWADVDTRSTLTSPCTYSDIANPPLVDGREAFFVNWINVASYNAHATPLNSFQIVIIDRSDISSGSFDFMFNYDRITWDTGDVSGTRRARAGWGQDGGSYYELPGSGVNNATHPFYDSSATGTALVKGYQNPDAQLGRYVWEVRNGAPPNLPPRISWRNRVLEGNTSSPTAGYTGYRGYTGASIDASATDADGTCSAATATIPAFLPLGTNYVSWQATDNDSAVTSVTQTVIVTDTTPPSNPNSLTSPTHARGVWSHDPTVTIVWAGAADTCSGVEGYSSVWSQNATQLPDAVQETTASSITTRLADGTWYYNLRTGDRVGNWSAVATSFGTVRIDSTVPTTTDNAPAGWRATKPVGVRLVATDTPSGVAYTRYRVNAGAVATYTTTMTVSAEGTTVIDYWSVDNAGNVEPTHTVFVLIDTIAPAGTFAIEHGAAQCNSTTVSFDASITADAYEMRFNNGAGAGFSPWMPYSASYDGTITAGDGTKTVVAQFRDPSMYSIQLTDTILLTTSVPHTSLTTAPPVPDGGNGWYRGVQPTVTLSADESGTVWYSWDSSSGPYAAYSGPLAVPQGAVTLWYAAVDLAGNREATHTAAFKYDPVAPTTPSGLDAAARDIDSIEVSWTASTDALSGIAYYRLFRDGSFMATTTATTYLSTGLTAGQTYSFQAWATDSAGNTSTPSAIATEALPATELWLEVSGSTVTFGGMDPDVPSTITTASIVSVKGVGAIGYDLTCEAPDFINADPMSDTPTMAIDVMDYITRGWMSVGTRPFTTGPQVVHSDTGVPFSWSHAYIFDYAMTVPWTSSPGTYTTSVLYTAVSK
jgi:hypothetical protein